MSSPMQALGMAARLTGGVLGWSCLNSSLDAHLSTLIVQRWKRSPTHEAILYLCYLGAC